MLVRQFSETSLAGKSVLDMGSGTGAIGIAAAKQGAKVTACDVNPIAVELSVHNALNNGVEIEPVQSDLYSDLDDRAFDLIFFNIPFYPRPATSNLEKAFNAGESFDVVRRFAFESCSHLTPSGEVVIVFSENSGFETIVNIFTEAGFRTAGVVIYTAIFEKYFVLTFVPEFISGRSFMSTPVSGTHVR